MNINVGHSTMDKNSEKNDIDTKCNVAACHNYSKDRLELMSRLWGNRKLKRVNEIIKSDYCGHLTVRELAVLALSDVVNFPQGIDTPICIGDFEGNFSTNIMSVSLGGTSLDKLDHLCIMGDSHGCME